MLNLELKIYHMEDGKSIEILCQFEKCHKEIDIPTILPYTIKVLNQVIPWQPEAELVTNFLIIRW